MAILDTWPCIPKWRFKDNEVPDPVFTRLEIGAYFNMVIGGTPLYAIATYPQATENEFHCRLYSDEARTNEITTGTWTGLSYTIKFRGGWIFTYKNGVSRWESNPVILYAQGGYWTGKWVVTNYRTDPVTTFEGDFLYAKLPIFNLKATIAGPGAVPAGTHVYFVSGVDASGKEGGASFVYITLTSPSNVDLTWTPVPLAVTYNIYFNCQLLQSGVPNPDYLVEDGIIEDPVETPDPEGDPTISLDPDLPIIVINPDDPEPFFPTYPPPGDNGGGSIIGTDPGSGPLPDDDVSYSIIIEPDVMIDPSLEDGHEEITTTVLVDDCYEIRNYYKGALIYEATLCTDPETGVRTLCYRDVAAGEVSEAVSYPINNLFLDIPYPIDTTYDNIPDLQWDTDPTRRNSTPPVVFEFPLDLNINITYLDEFATPVLPDDIQDVNSYLDFESENITTPLLSTSTGPATSGQWDSGLPFANIPVDTNIFKVKGEPSYSGGDYPGTTILIDIVVPGSEVPAEPVEFTCVKVGEDYPIPTEGTCKTSVSIEYGTATVEYGKQTTIVQCSPQITTDVDDSIWDSSDAVIQNYIGLFEPVFTSPFPSGAAGEAVTGITSGARPPERDEGEEE